MILRIPYFILKHLFVAIILAIYLFPLLVIVIIAFIWWLISDEDLTRTNIVQIIIRPLIWVENNLIKNK